jgi:hypothetical protein
MYDRSHVNCCFDLARIFSNFKPLRVLGYTSEAAAGGGRKVRGDGVERTIS